MTFTLSRLDARSCDNLALVSIASALLSLPWRQRAGIRAKSTPSLRARAQAVKYESKSTPLRSKADPGSWIFSPEWMGTQADGWGHNAGETVFDSTSNYGNGRIWVTRHFASKEDVTPFRACATEAAGAAKDSLPDESAAAEGVEQFQEWRVLRFNEETRQSVARVTVTLRANGHVQVTQRGDCMAFLYMKTFAAAVASLVGLAPEGSSLAAAALHAARAPCFNRCKVLCIGLGGGSLPLFMAHHFPGMDIDVVEIDPVVISAAEEGMGFPKDRPHLRVHIDDAAQWLKARRAAKAGCFDLVFVDAFDGENEIPRIFTTAGSSFLDDLSATLHPEHGAVLVNVHRGDLPPLWKQLLLKVSGSVWLDPLVAPVAQVYRQACLQEGHGVAYMLGVGKQYNTIVVAARGQHLCSLGKDLPARLREAAVQTAERLKFRFQASDRAVLDFVETSKQD